MNSTALMWRCFLWWLSRLPPSRRRSNREFVKAHTQTHECLKDLRSRSNTNIKWCVCVCLCLGREVCVWRNRDPAGSLLCCLYYHEPRLRWPNWTAWQLKGSLPPLIFTQIGSFCHEFHFVFLLIWTSYSAMIYIMSCRLCFVRLPWWSQTTPWSLRSLCTRLASVKQKSSPKRSPAPSSCPLSSSAPRSHVLCITCSNTV